MDPKRPQTPEEISADSEPHKQPAEPSEVDGTPALPTEANTSPVDVEYAATDDRIANADATTGAIDPANLFSSLDAGVQAMFDDVSGARAERPEIETAADNVLASAQTFVHDAFAPPAIEEIVASLSATPIADGPGAAIARDIVAGWQDVSTDSPSPHNNATGNNDDAPMNDGASVNAAQPATISVDIGGLMATEPVEPPAEANEDFDTLDRTPRANPADYIAIDNLLGRHDSPIVIQRGPVRTDDESWRPSITQLSGTSGDPSVPEWSADADLSPRATKLQSPTSDGGPPLARPILLASVPDEQTRGILDEALAEAGRRDAKTAAEIAQQQVEDAFWLRACEERALYGGR